MPEVDLGFGKSNMIRVRLSDEDARDFYRAAEIAYSYKAIPTADIEELMILSTKIFIHDMIAAQTVYAAKLAEEKRKTEPTHYMKNAIEQVESISDELDSWGEGGNNGRP